jgi:hypothetical protein
MLETIVGIIGVGLLGVIGWAVQLGNKVAVVETEQANLAKTLEWKLDDIKDRLERIENKFIIRYGK